MSSCALLCCCGYILFVFFFFFFFNDTATTEIYTLSLHDALPIYPFLRLERVCHRPTILERFWADGRSEEHTSELQSHLNLVCRLLLEKKKKKKKFLPEGSEESTDSKYSDAFRRLMTELKRLVASI